MQTSQTSPQRDSHRIEQEAVAWFTRMNGAPSAADRRDFQHWRQADPRNHDAYDGVAQLLNGMADTGARLAEEEHAALAGYLRVMDDAKAGRRRKAAAAGLTAGLLALLIAPWLWIEHPHLLQNLGADHVTARAERRNITLGDGSVVTLDADSAIDVEGRRVTLLRGQAYFDVVPSDLPFIVEAAGGQTRVLGTQFSVARQGEEVVVTLESGSVRVTAARAAASQTLSAGEQLGYGPAGVSPVSSVQPEDAMAWRTGRLVFDNARLGDVLQQIERYRTGRIVVLGSGLADHRVSGSLPLADSAAALAALQSTVGFRATSAAGRLVVISR